ncbi:MAG: hydroxymethylglutaryl-CoA lyase, partial [Shewanella sp.]
MSALDLSNLSATSVSASSDRVSLFEMGPRDGLQNEAAVPTQAKVALIESLADAGVKRIEAGS